MRLSSSEGKWYDRQEEVIHIESKDDYFNAPGRSLFDSIYGLDEKPSFVDSSIGISTFTLRDISDAYGFGLAYLGDFLVQIGCRPPIEVDIKVGDMLTGEQIYRLLEAINTLDPSDANFDFDSVFACELMEELDMSENRLIRICENEGFNLPFGIQSMLHKAAADRIIEVQAYDDYRDDDDETRKIGDDTIGIEDLGVY